MHNISLPNMGLNPQDTSVLKCNFNPENFQQNIDKHDSVINIKVQNIKYSQLRV